MALNPLQPAPLRSQVLEGQPNSFITQPWAGWFQAAQISITGNVPYAQLASTEINLGSYLIGFKAHELPNAVNRTIYGKAADMLGATDYGVVADGTDQTDAMIAACDYLDSVGYAGFLYIPYGIVYDVSQVISHIPTTMAFWDMSGVNGDYALSAVGHGSTSFKCLRIVSQDTTTNDTMFGVISGHNAALVLNNTGTAGTASASQEKATIAYRTGPTSRFFHSFAKQSGDTAYSESIVTSTTGQGKSVGSTIFKITDQGRAQFGGGSIANYNFSVGQQPFTDLDGVVDYDTTFGVRNTNHDAGSGTPGTATVSIEGRSPGGTTEIFNIKADPGNGYANFFFTGKTDAFHINFSDGALHVPSGSTTFWDSGSTMTVNGDATFSHSVTITRASASDHLKLVRTATSTATVYLATNAGGVGATDTFQVLDNALASILKATRSELTLPGDVTASNASFAGTMTATVNGSTIQAILTRTGTSAGTVKLGANAAGVGSTDTFNVLDSSNASIFQATTTGATFPGYVVTTTQPPGDNSTKAATTAFVTAAILAAGGTNPMTTLGDTIYGGSAGAETRLAGNTTATMYVLTQTGTGSASAAPVWTVTNGTGDIARTTSPTFTTPTLGAATATSINGNAITAGTGTLTLSTFTLTVAGTASVSGTNTGDQTSVSGNAGSASTIAIVDDTATNATMYPTWVTTTTGNLPVYVSSTKMTFNPSTGTLTSTGVVAAGAVTTTTLGGTAQITTGSSNGAIEWRSTNTSNGASALAQFRALNDSTLVTQVASSSSGRTGTKFGITLANYGELTVSGAAANGLILGCSSVDVPIIFGVNTSEVARFTGGTLSTAAFDVKYTTDSTTSTTGSLITAGGLGVAKAVNIGTTLTVTGHCTFEGVTSTGATGTGKLVFDGTPTLVTPVLGVATATTINKVTLTAPASGSTLTIADGKTFTCSNTITLSGTDSSGLATSGAFTTTFKATASATYVMPDASGAQLASTLYAGIASTTISNAGPSTIFTTGSAGSSLTVPTAFMSKPGATIVVEAEGTISTGSATPTIAMALKLGSTTLVSMSAVSLSTSISSKPFKLRATWTARVPGASATGAAHIEYLANTTGTTVNGSGADDTSATPATNSNQTLDLTVTTAAGTGTTSVVLTQQRVYLTGV